MCALLMIFLTAQFEAEVEAGQKKRPGGSGKDRLAGAQSVFPYPAISVTCPLCNAARTLVFELKPGVLELQGKRAVLVLR